MKFYSLILCAICIFVFVLQVLIPGLTDVLLLNQNSYYQIWRFFTSIFLHSGMAHILYNMFALALFGTILEGLIGSRRFLIVFFVTGILANLVAVNFYPSSLGASGAIFGVIGAIIFIRPGLMVWAFGFPMPMLAAGVLWAAGDIFGLFFPSNVGNIAHLAGMFFGLVFGAFYRFNMKNSGRNKKKIEYTLDENEMSNWENYYLK